MRPFIVILLLALATSAHAADRLFAPVRIKTTTTACPSLASLKLRDGLARDQRTETLADVNSLGNLTGECGQAPEGQWMYFDQANGGYVCLRPRLGADCAWVHRTDVGEIVEQVSNQKPNCQALGVAVEKSRKYEADLNKEYSATQPKNMAQSFVRGFLGDVAGMVGVNGKPVVVNADKRLSCNHDYVIAQETARRLIAYRSCPTLGNADQERTNYNATIKWANERCTPQ